MKGKLGLNYLLKVREKLITENSELSSQSLCSA
jgi:hypothetical protein